MAADFGNAGPAGITGDRQVHRRRLKSMPTIFISYRRADASEQVLMIRRLVEDYLPNWAVFVDSRSIGLGRDFRAAITEAIGGCDVCLAVIGPRWLAATTESGTRRLEDPDDWVRTELGIALGRGIPVVPVYVGGATPVPESALPEELRALATRQGFHVRPGEDFEGDVQRLCDRLRSVVPVRPEAPVRLVPGGDEPRPTRRWLPTSRAGIGLAITGVATCIAVSVVLFIVFTAERAPETGDPAEPAETSNAADEIEPPGDEAPTEPTGDAALTLERVLRDPVPYDPNFLEPVAIPLPTITNQLSAGDLLDGKVFDYFHYSLVMDERRAMPLYTACNVDRATMRSVRRDPDYWVLDRRVPPGLQRGEDLYRQNTWDRGHLVSRTYVTWGDEPDARTASRAVFFYTNSVPQHSRFNQGIWSRLEQAVRGGGVHPDSTRLCVFSGPVHRASDAEYRGVRIPQSFWKIVVGNDPQRRRNVLVAAFLIDQYTLTPEGEPEPIEHGRSLDLKTFQVRVRQIEELTALRFGIVKDFEPPQG